MTDAFPTPDDGRSAKAFADVWSAELGEIRASRKLRLPGARADGKDSSGEATTPAQAHDMNLVGLAFSGGGIRSATFNLGILQALAEHRALPFLDYLSTVSGGGYIGSWFASWCKRAGGVNDVQTHLQKSVDGDPSQPEVAPIGHLREHSNYLSPRSSLLNADFWVMISIWFRNTLLNQLVLIGLIASALLTARLIGQGLHGLAMLDPSKMLVLALSIALGGLLLPSFMAGHSVRWYTRDDGLPTWRQGQVLLRVVVPLVAAALAGACALWLWLVRPEFASWPSVMALYIPSILQGRVPLPIDSPENRAWIAAAAAFCGFTLCLWTVALVAGYRRTYFQLATPVRQSGALRFCESVAGIYGFAVLAAAFGGILVRLLSGTLGSWIGEQTPWLILTAGTAGVLGIFGLVKILHIGLLGFNFPDERREWWSRLGAWLLLASIGWLLLFGISVFGPWAIANVWVANYKTLSWTALGGWILTTLGGVISGKSNDTGTAAKQSGEKTPMSSQAKELLATVAPWLFLAGLLLLVSLGSHVLIQRLDQGAWVSWNDLSQKHFELILAPWQTTLAAWFACLAITALFAWRVDINEFSLHHFYKNRLVRGYLGATRKAANRVRNPFTGFDRFDDVKLVRFQTVDPLPAVNEKAEAEILDESNKPKPYIGPLPLLNTTLNLAAGTNLAWQERQGASFTFTPLYSGYDAQSATAAPDMEAGLGFRPTRHYGYEVFDGPAIGTVVAISGAAANPNSGYHTSPAVSFLMTFFNARLGWWMGNPRHRRKFNRSGPKIGIVYLLTELTSSTTDCSDYVNLSDGGHFENLGIYELVRRRCRLIFCCDAEEDHAMTFGGLGGAIRKCRTDFGVEISIDLDAVRPPRGERTSDRHWAVGTIRYPDGPEGYLVYFKSSLTKDVPADVREYADRETAFPHQSTGDQWFDESQFESYRRLGYHVGQKSLAPALQSLTAEPSTNSGARDVIGKLMAAAGKAAQAG